MPIRHLAPAIALLIAGALAACANGGRPLSYSPQSSSYPAPGPADDPWGPYIAEASTRFGVPQPWIRAVMHQESGGHEYLDGQPITSSAGAIGLMQLMPDTYADLQAQYDLGGDPYDPHDNILAGTAYIRQMYDKYGSPGFLAAYNAGPARVDDYLAGTSGLPAETVDYVAAITPHLGDDRASVELASASREAPPPPERLAAANGCVADPDAAYDPVSPCVRSPTIPTERPDPVSHDCVADPDVAFDPDRPCATGPVLQTVSYQVPSPPPQAPPIGSALGIASVVPSVPLPRRDTVATTAPMWRPTPVPPMGEALRSPGSWKIQVGAFGQEQEAHFATDIARDALSRRFGPTRSSIEPVRGLGGQLLYRARLAGIDAPQAASACTMLHGEGLPCMVVSPGA